MFLACFAPFLASSHPLLVKVDGKWSSPFVQHLGPADVVLPCVFVTGVVLLARRRLGMGQGVLLLIWVAAVTSVFAAGPDFYTALEAAGEGRGPVAGAWRLLARSPVLTALWYLTWVGMVAFAIVAALRWLPRRTAGVTAAILTPLCALLIVFPLRPPENVVYEQYRVLQAQGKTEFMLRTIVPYSPTDRLRDDPDARLTGPSAAHWAGTDAYGADLLSRMIHGCRIALAIGFIATGIEVLIGVFVGGLMGYFAGTIDLIGMRLIEIIEAIPRLVLLIAVTAAYGRNLYMMMAIIGLLGWTGDARFVRAEFLKLRKQDFVQAAVASGLPLRSILFRHMLPNGVTPVLVSASFGVASAILLESTLSFLGLGLVDEPSWGAMLEQARSGGAGFNWWIATFPGLLIFLTVFAYNLIGESVRDALDPKLLKRE
ncbi:MAG: ABC transporter permease [Phycisphaerae bacterium]